MECLGPRVGGRYSGTVVISGCRNLGPLLYIELL